MRKTGVVDVALERDACLHACALVPQLPQVVRARQEGVNPECVMRQGLIKKHEADMLPQ